MPSLRSNQSTRQQTKVLPQAAKVIVVILAAILITTGTTENISGVVNDYQVATYVYGKQVVVEDASNFINGDKILVMQMKGATISTSDDANYGDITEFGEAGNYELAEIRRVDGDTLQLTLSLCNSYEVPHLVQVIRVPVYESAKINGPLTALPWDGSKGGVVAIEATEKIILNSTIDVSEMGFRGGDRNGSARTGGLTYICDFSSGQGGIKGEGIVELPSAACRGKLANGGGGANDHNGGGGGGSGYGAGGQGGHGWGGYNVSDTDKGGRGGLSLQPYYDAGIPKLFLGGGGGGGHQNNGAAYPAGNGGGIVILITPLLRVNGNRSILAKGEDAQDHNINDGASGGGGGGSILLDVDSIKSPEKLTLDVSGGDGATLTTGQQHGPGGGGGGGLINSTSPLPDTINSVLEGGEAGLFISTAGSSNPYHNTSHGATDGSAGAMIHNLFLPVCSEPPSIDLNGADAGTGYLTSYQPGAPAKRITDSTLNDIQDLDDIEMQQMILTLTNPLDGADELLDMVIDSTQLAGMGMVAHRAIDGHQITVSGEAMLHDYLTVLGNVTYQDTAVTPNRTSRIVEVTVDDGGSLSNTAEATITFESGTFPVEWLGFEVLADGPNARLQWQTALEQNNHFFEVERGTDLNDFQPVGRVDGSGTTTEATAYDFLDTEIAQLSNPTFLYRIRQVDFNGVYSYSKLVEFQREQVASELSVNLFPNPASDHVNIQISGAQQGNVQIHLMSLNGQSLRTEQHSLSGSQGQLTLPLSGITAGTYIVQIRGQNQQKSLKLQVK